MAAPIHPLQIHRQDIKRFALAAVAIVAAAVAIISIQTITNNDTGTPANDVIVVNPANAASESAVTDSAQQTGPVDDSLSLTGPSIGAAAATTQSRVAEWAMASGLTGLSPASVGPIVDTADQPTSDTETSKIVTLEDELRAIHARG